MTRSRATGRDQRARLLAPVLAVAVGALLLLGAGPAAAHPAVARSTPAEDAVLDEAPTAVSITFGEEVEAPTGSVKVYDATSTRVDLDDAHLTGADLRTATVSLPPDLPPGGYLVIWRAIGLEDGHLVIGQQSFSVGTDDAVAPTAFTVPGSDGGRGWVRVAGAAHGAAVALVAGTALLAIVVLRGDRRWSPARRRLTVLLRGGVAVALLTGIATLVGAALERATAFGAPLDAGHVAAMLVAPVGVGVLARTFLLLPLLLRPLLGLRWFVLATSLAAVATLALDGHTAGPAVAAGVVHVEVAAAWGGGLVALAIALHHAPIDDAAGVQALLHRFGRLALACVGAAALAGGVLALATTSGPPAAVAATPWGGTLTAKTTVLVAALTVAAHTRFVLLPRLRIGLRPVPRGAAGVRTADRPDVAPPTVDAPGQAAFDMSVADRRTLGAVRRNVGVEAALVLLVLGLSGVLGTLDPAAAAGTAPGADDGHDDGSECAIGPVPDGMALAHEDCAEGPS